MSELHELTIHELSQKLAKGEISSVEVTRSVLSAVSEREKEVDAFLLLDEAGALEKAEIVDKNRSKGGQNQSSQNKAETFGPLSGIPYALKDILNTKGITTTCASKMLENYTPVYDATAYSRLNDANAIMVGKTNMDEFAMGSSTENSAYKKTKNPWDLERVPGGSSGGSAAAVAADMGIFALGTDTGGSIRQPAAFTGTVGLKPTYGLVSRYGLIAFASSLDQIGPITKDVRDSALVLSAIAGSDPKDSTCLANEPYDYTKTLENSINGRRIGIPKELIAEGIAPDVRERFEESIVRLEELGADVEETSLPNLDYSLSAYYLIAPAEASSNLARYDGVKFGYRSKSAGDIFQMYSNTRAEGFGAEVKRRIMLGTYALSAGYYSAYYGKANQVRSLIIQDFTKAFEKYDALISPTTPTTAFRLGEKTSDPLEMYLSDICTVPVNLAGLPAISIPCGLSDGLPVGFQLIGRSLGEEDLLNIAYQLEQAIDFKHLRREAKKNRSILEDLGWNLKLLSD